jgi:hypothetical protein
VIAPSADDSAGRDRMHVTGGCCMTKIVMYGWGAVVTKGIVDEETCYGVMSVIKR